MNGQIDILDIIRILALFETLLLGGMLFVSSSERRPSMFLGLFVFCVGLENLVHVANFLRNEEYRLLDYLNPFNFYLLNPAILYLYFKKVTGVFQIEKEFKHLIPGLLELLITCSLFYLPFAENLSEDTTVRIIELYYILSGVCMIFYAVQILLGIDHTRMQLGNVYSSFEKRKLKWLQRVAILCISTVILVWLIVFSLRQGNNMPREYEAVVIGLKMMFMAYVAGSGMLQTRIFGEATESEFSKNRSMTQKTKTSFSSENPFSKLEMIMEREKAYLSSDLNAYELAKQLGINQRTLSAVIQDNGFQNFNHYVNHHRVEEAKRLLTDREKSNYTILSISYEAGFNSKTTFYNVFKKMTGISPIQYKDTHSQKADK